MKYSKIKLSTTLSKDNYALVDTEELSKLCEHIWTIISHVKNRESNRYRYASTKINNKNIKMHRFLMDAPDGFHVDHINGNTLDNRKENLRIVTAQQNQGNSRKIAVFTSKFKGVCWQKASSKWRAYIAVNRRQQHLGLFENEIDAAKAYDMAAEKEFGEYAFYNLK